MSTRNLPRSNRLSKTQFMSLLAKTSEDDEVQRRAVDTDYFLFAHRLYEQTKVPVVRVPAGMDLAGAKFMGYIGQLEMTCGTRLETATTPQSLTVWRMIIQPYVQSQPVIGIYCPMNTGLLGPLQRPYTIGSLQLGINEILPYHDGTGIATNDPGAPQWTSVEGSSLADQKFQSAVSTQNIGKINNTWYLPRHVAFESGFMGHNNWQTQGVYPSGNTSFLAYLGTEGGWNMVPDKGGETPLLNVQIFADEIPVFRGQTMEQAGYVTNNSSHPGAWIHSACDNIWNGYKQPAQNGGTGGPNDGTTEFNNWGGQPPLGCSDVYPYANQYTVGTYEGGIITVRITVSNGAKCTVCYCGQNQIKEYGMHTLNARHTFEDGTATHVGTEDINEVQDAYSAPAWINQIDFFFDPMMVKAGNMFRIAPYETIVSPNDGVKEMFVALPFVQPRAGLCILHPPYLAWTLADVGITGTTYPGFIDYQHAGWGKNGMNCSSHWKVIMGWNGTSCGAAPWMGSVGGYPSWAQTTIQNGMSATPPNNWNGYVSEMDACAPQFPGSSYPSNATITLPYNDPQLPGYQGWNSVSVLNALASSDGLGTVGPGFGTKGTGAYSFRSFPMYIPGGDQRQPFNEDAPSYSKAYRNPLGGGAPYQNLMQQFISVVDGERITRAPNSVAQSLSACMPQLEVTRTDQDGDGSIQIQYYGTFYYNLLTPNASPLWPSASAARIVESARVSEVRKYAAACAGIGKSVDAAIVNSALKSQQRAQEAAHAEVRGAHSFLGRLGDALFEYGGDLLTSIFTPFLPVRNAENATDLASRVLGGPGTVRDSSNRGQVSTALASRIRGMGASAVTGYLGVGGGE